MTASCELCTSDGGEVLWRDALCRVVLPDDPLKQTGTCRVIVERHVKELSDLAPADLAALMQVVVRVERALIAVLKPVKINVASLGNQVPHVHWHVVPRWTTDRSFPDPIWAPAKREGVVPSIAREALVEALRKHL